MPDNPPDSRDHLQWIRTHRNMVLGSGASLAEAIAFVAGFDAATGYSLLRGFQEWLVVRLGGGFEFHWMALAKRAALGASSRVDAAGDADPTAAAVDRFFGLVLEFLSDVDDRDGRRVLYRRFDELRKEAFAARPRLSIRRRERGHDGGRFTEGDF